MAPPPVKCWFRVDGGYARTRIMIEREIGLTEVYMDHLSHKLFCFGYERLRTHLAKLNVELQGMVDKNIDVKYSNSLLSSDMLINR